jgi:mannose-1-phosphate guanylyltransferase
MAGGVGSRLWPASRSGNPKQFHDMTGSGKTLLRQTFERFLPIIPAENVFIVSHKDYASLVQKDLPEVPVANIICEPRRKNTGPCLAYAAYKISDINPEARVVVAPADHLILEEDNFRNSIMLGFEQTEKKDCLITLGIQPTRPDTGYGYIQFVKAEGVINERISLVKTFTEKPNLALAEKFLDSGDFLWNAGIFIWSLKSFIKGLEKHMPHTNGLFMEGMGKYNTPQEEDFINEVYDNCKNISIDYGLMEKASNVYVIRADFGWSDLGTWGSVYQHISKDADANAVVGKFVKLYDSSNCLINVPKNKLVVVQGLDDYIIVESDNILLICKKSEEQKIKQFVSDIKAEKGDRFI